MADYSHIRAQASRMPLFETPIAQCNLVESEGMISEIKRVVLEKKKNDAGINRSNVGGWHSDVDMLAWGGGGAEKIKDTAIGLAKRMSAFAAGAHDDYHWLCQMWANVSEDGASNHLHMHPGNLWSGAFYVDMGGADSQPGLGGEFYFEDPRFPLSVMHNTKFRFADAEGNPIALMPQFRFKPGDLVLFPAWLRHGVNAYRGSGTRISIAFNVDAVLK
ncbi:TIGR02466 family protein [Hirschia litorea]|uniref:TIGR02466 family protein n=1 Tax=Hirschia litorea TaxID=1199156 RepID=A0ABW2IHE5_9PROT